MAGDLINCEIPDHWELTTLGDVCQRGGGSIQTGPFGSQLHASDYVPVGIPSIMPTNIGDNRIVEEGIVRITEQDANRLGQHRLRAGDIVYSRRGDVEKRALIREREEGWLCGTGCLKVRLGSGVVDPLFASMFLGHPAIREWIVRHAVGATMPNLNTSIMSTVPFALPPIAEQKAIAAVLGTLDDKIELNRRMNATLEAMARALFQSWFVDFDPVRAKLDGRQPAGLDRATAALFPDSFQDSTLGTIPHGWRAVHLEAIASVGSGKRPEGRSDVLSPECNIPLYGGGGRIGYVTSALYDQPILLTGRVGTLGLIFRTAEPSWPSDNTLIVEPQPGLLDFTYFLLKGFDLLTLNRGSTQPLLTQADLKRQALVLPAKDVVKAFTDVSEPIFRKISSNERESCTLATLRDSLLPKLLSGELHINE